MNSRKKSEKSKGQNGNLIATNESMIFKKQKQPCKNNHFWSDSREEERKWFQLSNFSKENWHLF